MNQPSSNPDHSQPRRPDGDRPQDQVVNAPEWSRIAFGAIAFTPNPKGGSGLKIRKRWVLAHTVRDAWILFWRSAHSLDPQRTHKARDLACAPDWDDRPRGERIAIGRCLRLFTELRILPIKLMNPEKKSNLKYRLNDGLLPSPSIH